MKGLLSVTRRGQCSGHIAPSWAPPLPGSGGGDLGSRLVGTGRVTQAGHEGGAPGDTRSLKDTAQGKSKWRVMPGQQGGKRVRNWLPFGTAPSGLLTPDLPRSHPVTREAPPSPLSPHPWTCPGHGRVAGWKCRKEVAPRLLVQGPSLPPQGPQLLEAPLTSSCERGPTAPGVLRVPGWCGPEPTLLHVPLLLLIVVRSTSQTPPMKRSRCAAQWLCSHPSSVPALSHLPELNSAPTKP